MLINSVKNVRFWLIVIPLFYTMVGFIVVPWFISTQVPLLLKEKLHTNLNIHSATFNPFSFELKINGIALLDAQQNDVIRIKQLYIDFNPSHLLQKELLIHEILLEEPYALVRISKEGKLNLTELLTMPSDTNETTASSDALPLSFLIQQIAIHNGSLLFEDLSTAQPLSLPLSPINYTITNFGLDKEDLSIHALEALLRNEGKITLASSLSLTPLKLHGKLTLDSIALKEFWPYLMPHTPVQLTQGLATIHLPFWLDLSQNEPHFSIDKAALQIQNMQLLDAKQRPLISFSALELESINFTWPELTGDAKTLTLTQPFMDILFEKEYMPSFVKLLLPQTSPKDVHKTNQTTPLPQLTLHHLKIDNGSLSLHDKTLKQTKPLNITHLFLEANTISTDANQTLDYNLSTTIDTKSTITLQGSFLPKTQSIQSTLEGKNLDITHVQPYLAHITPLSIQKGFLSLKANLKASFASRTPDIKVSADTVSLANFLIHDAARKPFIAWDALSLRKTSYTSTPEALHVESIALEKPYVHLDIRKNHTTNFTNLITAHDTPKKSTAKPLELYIGKITLKNGNADFKDASLPIPFATYINKLNGSFSTLNTKNTKPSTLLLDGKVGKYGYTKVQGSFLPFDFTNRANLKLLFKNIDMPSLTPYSGKFLGYAIQKGKLSMDLSYTIKKGLMEGDNKINLDTLTLGKKVESAEALNLPLELAIALLQDSQGQIDIDLPVNGDMNDPDFKYGSIVWKAFGNLIGGIITSPFKLLGSIIGVAQSEGLKNIDFPAGEATLVASEEEKMEQYRQILEKKTALKLIIAPCYSTETDTLALKNKLLSHTIETMSAKNSKEENSYGKAIKALFIQKYGQTAYEQLLQTLNEEKRDRGYINETLKTKILDTIQLPENAMQTLAQERINAVMNSLQSKYHIASSKLKIGELTAVDAIRESWIGCAVSVSN